MSFAAGWYPDPNDASSLRYYDGTQWTDHTAPNNQAPSVEQAVEAASEPVAPQPQQPAQPPVVAPEPPAAPPVAPGQPPVQEQTSPFSPQQSPVSEQQPSFAPGNPAGNGPSTGAIPAVQNNYSAGYPQNQQAQSGYPQSQPGQPFQVPQQGGYGAPGAGYPAAAPAKKKGSAGLLIGILALVLVLAGGGFAVWKFLLSTPGEEYKADTEVQWSEDLSVVASELGNNFSCNALFDKVVELGKDKDKKDQPVSNEEVRLVADNRASAKIPSSGTAVVLDCFAEDVEFADGEDDDLSYQLLVDSKEEVVVQWTRK